MNEKHHPLGPSNYPAWAKCQCYDNSPERNSSDASAGKAIHKEVEEYFNGSGVATPKTDESIWAVEKIKELSSGAEVKCEVLVSAPEASALGGIFGTVDAMWKSYGDDGGVLHIADVKSFSHGESDYMPQLRGYAAICYVAGMCDDCGSVSMHILHCGSKSVEEEIVLPSDALDMTLKVLAGHAKGEKSRLCKWCQWCSRVHGCAETNNALTVAGSNAPSFSSLSLAQKLVVLEYISKVSDTIRDEARRVAAHNGGVLEQDGIRYELKTSKGRAKVSDICALASNISSPTITGKGGKEESITGLTSEEVIGMCDLPKSAVVAKLYDKNRDKATKASIERWVGRYYANGPDVERFVRVK